MAIEIEKLYTNGLKLVKAKISTIEFKWTWIKYNFKYNFSFMDLFKGPRLFFYRYLPVIFLVFAGLALYSTKAYPVQLGPDWVSILDKIGIATFSSGVFAAVLKSLQFQGIFRQELEDTMLTTKFIKNRKDLPSLWKDISNAVYDSKFPDISTEIDDLILSTYLPTEKQFYYQDITVSIKILNLTEDKLITYSQTVSFTVIPAKGVKMIPLTHKYTLEEEFSLSSSTLEYFKVDRMKVEPELVKDTNGIEVEHRFPLFITPDKTYHVEKKQTRVQSLTQDNIILFRVGTFTKGMEVDVQYPENIRVQFFEIGTVNNFDKKNVEFTGVLSASHKKGVILPRQGWGITIREHDLR